MRNSRLWHNWNPGPVSRLSMSRLIRPHFPLVFIGPLASDHSVGKDKDAKGPTWTFPPYLKPNHSKAIGTKFSSIFVSDHHE